MDKSCIYQKFIFTSGQNIIDQYAIPDGEYTLQELCVHLNKYHPTNTYEIINNKFIKQKTCGSNFRLIWNSNRWSDK